VPVEEGPVGERALGAGQNALRIYRRPASCLQVLPVACSTQNLFPSWAKVFKCRRRTEHRDQVTLNPDL
jgi:hypothetical protein